MSSAGTRRRFRKRIGTGLPVWMSSILVSLLLVQCGQPDGQKAAGALNLKGVSKEEYTVQVAQAYVADHDLAQAQAQLAKLDVPNVKQWVAYVADSYLAEGKGKAEIAALDELARGLGVESPQMAAFLATPTPRPTDTPQPTDTPSPTATPRPTETPTATPTPIPTDTPTLVPPTLAPTNTSTFTPAPPTHTAKPKATKTPKPTATATKPPAPTWSWTAVLLGPPGGPDRCSLEGDLQVRVTVVDANGAQIPNVWIYDMYSPPEIRYQVTGNMPDMGPGETRYEYGRHGGGGLCIAQGQGGPCITEYTRNLPCFDMPPIEDMYAAGYCNCCEYGASFERCQELYNQGTCLGSGHYRWQVTYKRGF